MKKSTPRIVCQSKVSEITDPVPLDILLKLATEDVKIREEIAKDIPLPDEVRRKDFSK